MKIKDATLEKHIKNNCLAPSYLLIDQDIVKLKAISNWLAEGFNTADIFRLEGNPNILVKETEDFLTFSNLKAIGSKKLFIIFDASTMTVAAQNKALKTIEETTSDTVFLLLASSASRILNTIKSRCVTIYPEPITPSLTEAALLNSNPNTNQIFTAVESILTKSKSLDDSLPHLPLLCKRENLPVTFAAFNHHANTLTIQKRNAIFRRLAIINRNIAAGCNAQNIFDTLLLELYK